MSVRDAGLVAIGLVAGWMGAGLLMLYAAHEIEATDRFMRALRLRYNKA